MFFIFSHRTFFKTIIANRTNGTFDFAQTNKTNTSEKLKEPFFSNVKGKLLTLKFLI